MKGTATVEDELRALQRGLERKRPRHTGEGGRAETGVRGGMDPTSIEEPTAANQGEAHVVP